MSFPTCATAATRRLGRGLCRGLTAALNFWGVRWAEVSQPKKSKHQLQVCSCNDENGFHPSLRWFDWFCPYFTERDRCKNGLEQRLADQCALTEPQETKNNHIMPGSRALFSARWLFWKEKVLVWTGFGPWASPAHLVLLNLSSARGGRDLKPGLDFITLRACTWKRVWRDLYCSSVCLSISYLGALHRQIVHSQLMLQLVWCPGKATGVPGQTFRCELLDN